jgi:hypothetical protein
MISHEQDVEASLLCEAGLSAKFASVLLPQLDAEPKFPER